jgi:hypothetical protein
MTFLLYRRPELENTLMVKNRSVYRIIFLATLVTCLTSLPGWVTHARGENVEWVRQLGTTSKEFSLGVSADGLGNVYISGPTDGSLGGPNAGLTDAFVSKYDAAGSLLWTRQLGTTNYDGSRGVSADGLGNVYISGTTYGSLDGPHVGNGDAFVSKYDEAGSLLWTRQVATTSHDYGYSISADGLGNVYLSGATGGSFVGGPIAGQNSDAFLRKYDAAGNLLWTRQLGTDSLDEGTSISADGLGNVYISGGTGGSLGGPISGGGPDAFLSKYDAAGSLLWTRQLGTTETDFSEGVSADGLGNVYISGITGGDLGAPNAGSYDAFLSKYDSAGSLLWTRQIGTENWDESYGVSADGLGNVYLSVTTYSGLDDAYVSKYDAAGNFLWTRQIGAANYDFSYGVSADGMGNVYLSGAIGAIPGGPFGGEGSESDAFVAKISDFAVPEPSTLALAAISTLGLAVCIQRRRGDVCALVGALFVPSASLDRGLLSKKQTKNP